jgi:hypothetical protein
MEVLGEPPMLQSGQLSEEPEVYVVDSRTDHGEWKPAKFSDKKTAQDFADALIACGFVVRFLTQDDDGELELEWEAVAEQRKLA